MNSFLKKSAVAAVLSLALAPVANAMPLTGQSAQSELSQLQSTLIVAQAEKTTVSTLSPKEEMILEMLNQYMMMRKRGQAIMKSSDPEIQKMGQAMVKTSDTEISKLVKMMRADFLANPDR
jgi:hypothetical protein